MHRGSRDEGNLILSNFKFRISDLTRSASAVARSPKGIRWNRPISKFFIGLIILLVSLRALDWCFPLPVPGRSSPYAVVVVARDGTPLRAFPGDDHVWRHPVSLNEVSPLYLDALVRYEDRM